MITIPKPLLSAAKSHRLIPFVGAGFSRVFNLPNWSDLIVDISSHLGFAPEIASLYGDFLQLAEYLNIQKNGLGEFRSELDKRFNSYDIEIHKSEAHLLLPELNAPAIYTTNWDSLIERSFNYAGKAYNKIVSFDDFAKANPDNPSIVKFHGDLSASDSSIVFTESSYFSRMDFESPLDLRLRSDMLGNTLLFLGYSLSDYNVRYMWYKLQRLMALNYSARRRDPFAYIVVAQSNPIFEEICKHSREIEVITLDSQNVQGSMIKLLKELSENAKC